MKKLTITIALTIVVHAFLFSQECLPEGITFTSQEQINNFQTDYPNCNEIGGSLEINGDDINNLIGINVITAINGDLIIRSNTILTNLVGLGNLVDVKGNIEIRNNPTLSNLTGIDNIRSDSVTGLIIQDNFNLSVCNVEFVCNFIEENPDFYNVMIYGNAESCIDVFKIRESCGNLVYFSSQSDIDNFQSNYPGISKIDVDVLIHGEDITNLDNLEIITEIAGSLLIYRNDSLTSCTGLNSLKTVENGISIDANKSLISLIGLNSLSFNGGGLSLHNNKNLQSLEGLEALTTINGELMISSSKSLTSFNGLNNIKIIDGNVIIVNSGVLNFSGLNSLSSINGDLRISDNNKLMDLSGLDALEAIDGELYISYNDSLISLSGIDNLAHNSITNLWISNNSSLSVCEVQSVCDFLVSPQGSINITNNNEGCNNPIEVASACGNDLSCLPYGNYYFTTQSYIDDFQSNYPNCNTLAGNVLIEGNYITSLDGLNNVTNIGGYLFIMNNKALTSLLGLEKLTSIGSGLHIGEIYGIGNNPVLASLAGLENLSNIGEDLTIANNDALLNLNELSNVTSNLSYLTIENNNALSSLKGLDNFIAESTLFLRITENSFLSTCDIKSICDYLIAPNGSVDIWDNATGCNNNVEITDACSSGVPDNIIDPIITIYPNPAERVITILHKDGLIIDRVAIYDQVGHKVLYNNNITNSVDVSILKQGMYIVEVSINELIIREKLIVK